MPAHRSTVRLAIAFAAVITGLTALPAQAQSPGSAQRLQDRAEIEELVARYVHALDTLDAEAFESVFTEDAVYDVTGNVYEGREAIMGIITGLQSANARAIEAGTEPAALYHVMSNTSIEILSDNKAKHISYAQTVRAAEDGQFVVGFMGRYEDDIVKRDGRWQIQSRKLVSFVR